MRGRGANRGVLRRAKTWVVAGRQRWCETRSEQVENWCRGWKLLKSKSVSNQKAFKMEKLLKWKSQGARPFPSAPAVADAARCSRAGSEAAQQELSSWALNTSPGSSLPGKRRGSARIAFAKLFLELNAQALLRVLQSCQLLPAPRAPAALWAGTPPPRAQTAVLSVRPAAARWTASWHPEPCSDAATSFLACN